MASIPCYSIERLFALQAQIDQAPHWKTLLAVVAHCIPIVGWLLHSTYLIERAYWWYDNSYDYFLAYRILAELLRSVGTSLLLARATRAYIGRSKELPRLRMAATLVLTTILHIVLGQLLFREVAFVTSAIQLCLYFILLRVIMAKPLFALPGSLCMVIVLQWGVFIVLGLMIELLYVIIESWDASPILIFPIRLVVEIIHRRILLCTAAGARVGDLIPTFVVFPLRFCYGLIVAQLTRGLWYSSPNLGLLCAWSIDVFWIGIGLGTLNARLHKVIAYNRRNLNSAPICLVLDAIAMSSATDTLDSSISQRIALYSSEAHRLPSHAQQELERLSATGKFMIPSSPHQVVSSRSNHHDETVVDHLNSKLTTEVLTIELRALHHAECWVLDTFGTFMGWLVPSFTFFIFAIFAPYADSLWMWGGRFLALALLTGVSATLGALCLPLRMRLIMVGQLSLALRVDMGAMSLQLLLWSASLLLYQYGMWFD